MLEGYSSARYIDLLDVKHMSVGESFAVTVKTNQKNLTWLSSDSNFLSVNEKDGTIKAYAKGIAFIMVSSDFGLEDSCIIAVE